MTAIFDDVTSTSLAHLFEISVTQQKAGIHQPPPLHHCGGVTLLVPPRVNP